MFQRVPVDFSSLEEFLDCFERSLSKGGMLVETDARFEPNEVVELTFAFPYCQKSTTLMGQVVNQTVPELAASSSGRGAALLLLEPLHRLRERFLELLQVDLPPEARPWPARPNPMQRAPRVKSHLPLGLQIGATVSSAYIRNLSRVGALVSISRQDGEVGARLCLLLTSQSAGSSCRVLGRVVRRVESQGRVVAIAVDFDPIESQDSDVAECLEETIAREHAQQLVAVTGALETLGLVDVVQMLSTLAKGGTLTLEKREEEGRVVFEGSRFCNIVLGPVVGGKAFARLCRWSEGSFRFYPVVAPSEPRIFEAEFTPAILEATLEVDELRRREVNRFPAQCRLQLRGTFAAPGDEVQAAVLDHAASQSTVAEVLDTLPYPDSAIYYALEALANQNRIVCVA